jgi:3-oxoacyl-[acyl-carrier protein] reductase
VPFSLSLKTNILLNCKQNNFAMSGQHTRFKGKHVLITGGARGIGLEIARQFAREGAILTLFDNHAGNLEQAGSALKKLTTVYPRCVDISHPKDVLDNVDLTDATLPIDILINNAGIAFETPFLKIEEEEWRRVLDINLTGMFFVSQNVCRKMVTRRRGIVVNMGSKNSLDGEAGYSHYNASKGAVVMLTKTMALELAPYGIRVNAVCPGYIQTPMSKEIDSPEFVSKFVERFIPLNRPGSVEDVAPAFLFLASDETSFMTGQTIIIDGGQLCGQMPDERFKG